MLLQRKGDPTDIVLFLVIIFFVCISMVVALYANGKLQDIISTTVLNESSAYESINESFSNINRYVVQRAFVLFFGLLVVGMLVSAFLVRVHPVFIFIYILTLGVSIFVSIYLANAYEMVVSNGQLAELALNFATMTWVMQNIAMILLGVGALSMIIILAKVGGGGGVSGGTGDL